MTPEKEQTDDLLKRALRSPSSKETRAALDRVYERLLVDAGGPIDPLPAHFDSGGARLWRTWTGVGLAAAVLIAAALLALWKPGSPVRLEGTDARRSLNLLLAADDSLEVKPGSEVSLAGGNDWYVRLTHGAVIVRTLKQTPAIPVLTRDLTVHGDGSVFLVDVQEEGSRVGVIEGAVRVEQDGATRTVLAGEQMATSPVLEETPVEEAIAWSERANEYVDELERVRPVDVTGAVADTPRPWVIQLSAFDNRSEADVQVKELMDWGYSAYVMVFGATYRVRVGNFATRAEAEEVAARLRADGLLPNPPWITRQ